MNHIPTLNEVLGPLFKKYGLHHNTSYDPTSDRKCKHGIKMLAWSGIYDFDLFVYADNTIGLRDWHVSDEVQVDLDMTHPDSCIELEKWLEKTVRKYAAL